MRRREFIWGLIVTTVAYSAVLKWLAGKVMPRKVLYADKTNQYPGTVVPMRDVSGQGKWSG